VGSNGFIAALTQAIRKHRLADPTAPVTVLVATGTEAAELRTTLARCDEPVLHLGVRVLTPTMCAGAPTRTATTADAARAADAVTNAQPASVVDSDDLFEIVHLRTASGYFANLDGLLGVTEALTAAVRLWDGALPQQRDAMLVQAPSEVDRGRLRAVAELHRDVAADCAAAGVKLPSELFAVPPTIPPDELWIDATVGGLPPVQRDWLARRQGAGTPEDRCVRIDPAALPVVGPEVLTSAVDPYDECGLAARSVTAALESGVAARDIAVVVPWSVFARYADLIGGLLDSAGITHDVEALSPARVGSTRVGSALAVIGASAAEVVQPGDVRFDHLLAVIRAAGLPVADGESVTSQHLVQLWEQVRGSDPAFWSQTLEPPARSVAQALEVARSARTTPTLWPELASAIEPLVSSVRTRSEADGVASDRVGALLAKWASRSGAAKWSQAWEEVNRLLAQPLPGTTDGTGVRIVELAAGWAVAPDVAIVVGLSDDIVPGVQAPVGPLTADEVVALKTSPSPSGLADDEPGGNDDARSLRALQVTATKRYLSYPRSDQLRTIMREPSRFISATVDHAFESITAQFDAVDAGTLGLLGPRDAAAALVRSAASSIATDPSQAVDAGVAALPGTADLLGAVAACTTARYEPPEAGGVDPFNGDLRGLDESNRPHLSPDFRSSGEQSASPSALEFLRSCPIGWWANRIIKVREPDEWDPPTLEQPSWGKWLHRALVLLSERSELLADDLSDGQVAASLWAAAGGHPSEALNAAASEPEILGYRFRITDADIIRATRELHVIAKRLRTFLAGRGGPIDTPVHEASLAAGQLQLPSGPLPLAGRVDRIDSLSDARYLITDYKTGKPGSGFQLAVYAWLWLLEHPGRAELLYATTIDRQYEATALLEDGPTQFGSDELEDYLREYLADAVGAARSGTLASNAWSEDHNRYCPVCTDLVPAQDQWGASSRSERAVALAAVPAPAVDHADADSEVTP
jgi:RecB family exonuclease